MHAIVKPGKKVYNNLSRLDTCQEISHPLPSHVQILASILLLLTIDSTLVRFEYSSVFERGEYMNNYFSEAVMSGHSHVAHHSSYLRVFF